jgi:hypothetical protein
MLPQPLAAQEARSPRPSRPARPSTRCRRPDVGDRGAGLFRTCPRRGVRREERAQENGSVLRYRTTPIHLDPEGSPGTYVPNEPRERRSGPTAPALVRRSRRCAEALVRVGRPEAARPARGRLQGRELDMAEPASIAWVETAPAIQRRRWVVSVAPETDTPTASCQMSLRRRHPSGSSPPHLSEVSAARYPARRFGRSCRSA